jgi:hypothetical protein
MDAEQANYQLGQLVMFDNNICQLIDIQLTNLGFRKYQLCDLDKGTYYEVAKHQLRDVDFLELDENMLLEANENENIDNNVEASTSKGRFADLTDSEVDDVAKRRLSEKTESQTRWAVNILKGKKYYRKYILM